MGCVLYNEGKICFLFSKFQRSLQRVNDTYELILDLHVTSSMSSPKNGESQFKLHNLLFEQRTFFRMELRCCDSLWQWHGFCRFSKGQFTIHNYDTYYLIYVLFKIILWVLGFKKNRIKYLGCVLYTGASYTPENTVYYYFTEFSWAVFQLLLIN